MGEVIPFPKKPRKEEGEQPQKREDAQYDIWFRIPENIQMWLESMWKAVNITYPNLDPRELMKQKEIVREWSDEDVIKFIGNKENQEMLKQNPYLFTAVYERITGEWE